MADRKTFFRQEDMKACFRVQLTTKLQFSGEVINEQNVQTVGAAGIPARGIAARNSASYSSLQCRGQECPRLLQLAVFLVDSRR